MSDERDSETRPLRLLSLDGGGIRGYSELKILQLLMHRIAWDQNIDPDKSLKPYKYFDLIGGTSTGGIIAVLLGRMRLTVDECLELYSELAKDVFGQERYWSLGGFLQARFDAKTLKNVVINTLEKHGFEESTTMFDDSNVGCKTFVTATPGKDVGRNKPRLFRTYIHRAGDESDAPDCKIWEAVRATSAAPTFFDEIEIDDQVYVDGGVGCNNPCKQVLEEAGRLWPGREIGCIISLGTGMPRVLSMQGSSLYNSWDPRDWVGVLTRIATLCDQTHQDMLRKRELRGKYFRFNVQQGMQTISLQEWTKLGEVATHTEVYLRDADIAPKFDDAIAKLLEAHEEMEEKDLDDEAEPRLPTYAESRR